MIGWWWWGGGWRWRAIPSHVRFVASPCQGCRRRGMDGKIWNENGAYFNSRRDKSFCTLRFITNLQTWYIYSILNLISIDHESMPLFESVDLIQSLLLTSCNNLTTKFQIFNHTHLLYRPSSEQRRCPPTRCEYFGWGTRNSSSVRWSCRCWGWYFCLDEFSQNFYS